MIGFNNKSKREKEDEDIKDEEENLVEEEPIKGEDKKKKKKKKKRSLEDRKKEGSLSEEEIKKRKTKNKAKDKEHEDKNVGGSELDKSIIINIEEENTIIAPKKIKELIIEAIEDTGVIDILIKKESISRKAAINKAVDLLFDLKLEKPDPIILEIEYKNAGEKTHASCHPCADRLLELFGKNIEVKQAEIKVKEPVDFGKNLSIQVAQDINTSSVDHTQGFIHRVRFGTHSFTLLVRFGRVEILQAFANEASLYEYMEKKQEWEYEERNLIIEALRKMTSNTTAKIVEETDEYEVYQERGEGQFDLLGETELSERGGSTYLEDAEENYEEEITIGWKRAKLHQDLQQIIENKIMGNYQLFKNYFK